MKEVFGCGLLNRLLEESPQTALGHVLNALPFQQSHKDCLPLGASLQDNEDMLHYTLIKSLEEQVYEPIHHEWFD